MGPRARNVHGNGNEPQFARNPAGIFPRAALSFMCFFNIAFASTVLVNMLDTRKMRLDVGWEQGVN